MKQPLLVCSDFDRTLKINNQISSSNLMAIKQLRALGHYFVINTGRSYQNFKEEMKNHDFKFDYAVCGSGSQIVDKDFNLLHAEAFERKVGIMLVREILDSQAQLIQFSSESTYQVYRRHEASWNDQITESLPDLINTFSCRFHDPKDTEAFAQVLSKKEGFNAFINLNSIDIVGPRVSKASGLSQLMTYLNQSFERVYTIGDGKNDVELVQSFNGYVVENAVFSLKQVAKGKFKEVSGLIHQLLEQEKKDNH